MIRFTLNQFDEFLQYILFNLIRSCPLSSKSSFFVEPIIIRVMEFIFLFLVRMNLDLHNYISLIKASNYFAETDEDRKNMLENMKTKIIMLNEKIVKNIMAKTEHKFSKQRSWGKISIFRFV